MDPVHKENGITLIHGSCEDILPTIADGSVHMVLTDPPYGIRWESRVGGERTPLANDDPDNLPLIAVTMKEASRILIPGGAAAYFCQGSPPMTEARWVTEMARVMRVDERIIWRKPGLGLGHRYRRCYETIIIGHALGAPPRFVGGRSVANVMEIRRTLSKAGMHPTRKPLELVEQLIRAHTEPGDLIVDPFAGSGTTLIAARNLGRQAIGIEQESRWCEEAIQRLKEGRT